MNEYDTCRHEIANCFDAQERSVLALAARDPFASISFDKRKVRGLRALIFGAPYNYCLANGKLETLRVTAILLRRGDFPPEQFYRFRMAGYSRGQFDAIIAAFARSGTPPMASSDFDLEAYAQAA